MENFPSAFKYTIGNEGSTYTNDPNDSGGPTKFGITLGVLGQWHQLKGYTTPSFKDVENLTEADAQLIYEGLYWNELGLDSVLDAPVASAIFDVAVNMGQATAARFAQAAANVAPDGHLGPISMTAINSMHSREFMQKFICQVQNHYIGIVQSNPAKISFLGGWLSRSQRLITLMM